MSSDFGKGSGAYPIEWGGGGVEDAPEGPRGGGGSLTAHFTAKVRRSDACCRPQRLAFSVAGKAEIDSRCVALQS